MLIAYCFRDGRILADSAQVPEGAVELFRGPDKEVRRLIEEVSDEGYVPGLEESKTVADDQQHLLIFLDTARDAASRLVTVNDLTQDILQSDREVS